MVVRRLLQSAYAVNSILAEPIRLAELEPHVNASTPVYVVRQELIRDVAGFNFHRGLLACGQRIKFSPIASLDTLTGGDQLALGAISLNDLENLGSLLRTAAALGIFHIVLNRQTVDPLCRRVLRVSMGAALRMTYYDLDDPVSWLEGNRRSNAWQTIAMTLAPDSMPLDQAVSAAGPTLILLGNEADGLPLAIQQACHVRAQIPMAAGIDSLNVAVAGAIALYEFTRSRAE